jgi:hypothetical protein
MMAPSNAKNTLSMSGFLPKLDGTRNLQRSRR